MCPLRRLFARRPSVSRTPPGIPEARRSGTRYSVFDTEWDPPRHAQIIQTPEALSRPEPPSRGPERIRRRQRTPGSRLHPQHSRIRITANRRRRSVSEAPFTRSFATGGAFSPDNGTRPAFGQPPNAPWIQPYISLPGTQRIFQEHPDPGCESGFSHEAPVINFHHVPQVVTHSRWASPWVDYDSLRSWPPIQKNIYKVPVTTGRHQEGHTVTPVQQGYCNASERLPNLLSDRRLKWDIRFPPFTSDFDPARSYRPNLDLPALSDNIHVAEIRLNGSTGTWGLIQVRRRYESSPITIRDLLEAIYQYFIQPLSLHEAQCVEAIPVQKDEMVMAYRMRQRAQGARDQFYRRCDLLQNGMCNFNFLEVQSERRNMVKLRLHLY